jgi:hypothetical protein
MALRLDEGAFDSRDEHTTELILEGLSVPQCLNLDRVEIDPFAVFCNMIENCFPGPDVENVDDVTLASLQQLFEVQKRIRAVLDLYPQFIPAG